MIEIDLRIVVQRPFWSALGEGLDFFAEYTSAAPPPLSQSVYEEEGETFRQRSSRTDRVSATFEFLIGIE